MTRSQRRWTWNAGDETGKVEVVEAEGGNLFETASDFDSERGVVAAGGRSLVPGNDSEVGFGDVVQGEDIEKIEMGAGDEAESVIVRVTEYCPRSLSGHLVRWCFGKGRDLKLHPLDMTGVAGWMTKGSPLKMERGEKD